MRWLLPILILLFGWRTTAQTISGMSILPDGFSAHVFISGFSSNTLFFNGFTNKVEWGVTNKNWLSHTNGMRLDMVSPGWSNGVEVVRARASYGTDLMRLAYPGQATNDVFVDGTTLRLRIALSSIVASNDASIIATVLQDAFIDGSTRVTPTSSLEVTNRSTRNHGLAFFVRTCPDEERITNTSYRVSVMANHMLTEGDGKTVDTVDFIITGATSGVITTNRLYALSMSYVGDAVPQAEYWTNVNLSGYTQGEKLRFDVRVMGMYGSENDVLDTRNNLFAAPLPSSWTNLYDPANTMASFISVVDISGDDATAVATNTTPGNFTSPKFASIAKAALASLNSNSANAAIVYVRSGITNSSGSSQTFSTDPKSRIKILEYPGDSVIFTNQSGTQNFPKPEYIGFEFRGSNQTFSGLANALFTDCIASNHHAGMFLSCTQVFWNRGRINHPINGGLKPNSIENTSFFVRGADLNGVSGTMAPKLLMGCINSNTPGHEYKLSLDYAAGQTMSPEFGIHYGNKLFNSKHQLFSIGENLSITNGYFAGNMVLEFATNNSGTGLAFTFTKMGKQFYNCSLRNITAAGQRWGFCYNDGTPAGDSWRYVSADSIVDEEYGTKTDDWAGFLNGAGTNNWSFIWQTDSAGNFHAGSSQYGGTGFEPEFLGFHTYELEGSGTNATTFTQYLDPQTYNLAGAGHNPPGNGNYAVQTNSPILSTANGTTWALPYDVNGNPRYASNNIAGAFSAQYAGNYYVAKGGDDANSGHQTEPWLTIQHAADTVTGGTVHIGSGFYDEYVESGNHGTLANPIRFQPNETNLIAASVRQFRLLHQYNQLAGLTVEKSIDIDPGNINSAHIRVEPTAKGTFITNCFIANSPLMNARIHFVNNATELLLTITNSEAGLNFHTNGFVVGGLIFLGASSVSNAAEVPIEKWYVNHDKPARIKSMSADGQTITITNNGATNWFTETVQSKWASIYAGTGSDGIRGVLLALGSGVQGPTNCTVIGNTFSNLAGSAFAVYGESNLFERNYFTKLNASYACNLFGRHNTVRLNTWRNSPNRLWLTDQETATATHPPGSEFFDYNIGAVHSQASDTTNITFELNWIENFEQQLGVFDQQAVHRVGGFNVRSNVFIGSKEHFSQNANFVTNRNNTWYRVAYEAGHALPVGGPEGTGILQTNIHIEANAFVACGEAMTPAVGWYSSSDTFGSNFVNNFACGPEVTGWHIKAATVSNPLAFNGGDPGFVNILNPIGPDGLAFTADDGLRPMPNSILAVNGIGALTAPAITVGTPMAHFTVYSPTNWTDYIYTNWNPGWMADEAPDRGGPVRPYTTPDPVGNVPVQVLFSATNSIDGVSGSTTNTTIVWYGWDFGDGGKRLTTYPSAAHTFCLTGTFLVTLSVTNATGGWNQSSNLYRVLPFTNYAGRVYYSSVTGNDTTGTGTNQNLPWRTIQKSATAVTSNGVVVVLPGLYDEIVDITQNSAADKRTRFISLSASNSSFNVRKADYTFDGFDLNGTNLTEFLGLFYLYEDADRIHMVNNYLHGRTNMAAVYMALPTSTAPADGQLDCIISNNITRDLDWIQIQIHGTNHVVTRNYISDSGGEGDAFRIFGQQHRISLNTISNMNNGGGGGHSDQFQTFGDSGYHAKDIIIERNIFIGTTNFGGTALCQFEQKSSAVYDYTNGVSMTNWIIRNNIFANLEVAGSVDIDGTKWFNNLFYRVKPGHTFALGGPKGSALGFELKNNVFFECGYNTNNGWYPAIGSVSDGMNPITNYTLSCNYNFIVFSNGLLVAEFPNVNNGWRDDSQEANGVNGGNPAFTDAANYNFRPLGNSALIDIGTDLSAQFTDDYDGATRSGAWDIGPFQFDAGSDFQPPRILSAPFVRALSGGRR